ncbi:hypothetical protein A3731_22955 [Roseovarius sp. HI0049]|nr:hypothetical protein A3731_22955 [Roseovarius sp. HI0049]
MQDRTIDNALLALLKQIIREDGDGLGYVEALLQMRGVDMPRVLPPKRKDVAGKGLMTRLVLEALRDGPQTAEAVTAYVAPRRPELSPEAARKRTSLALTKMKKRGLVKRDGRAWIFNPHP